MMEGYGYGYPPPPFAAMMPDGQYQDHGDGFGDYYDMDALDDEGRRSFDHPRRTRSKRRSRRSRSRSLSRTDSKTRSRSGSKTGSMTRNKSRSRSRSRSRTRSGSRNRPELKLKEPGLLDAFRVLYLTPNCSKKNPRMYLATKKRLDRVEEYLKSDGLGSKRWLFYPRSNVKSDPSIDAPGSPGRSQSRNTCDQRVKIDGEFFRKYKRSMKVDAESPITKLKRWELLFYKKLGFIQAL